MQKEHTEGQGSIEYILMLTGALVLIGVVLSLTTNLLSAGDSGTSGNLDGIDTSFPIGPDGVNILSPTTAKPSTGGARTIRVDFKVGSQVKDYTLKIINGTTTLCSQSGSAPLPLKEQVISPTTCHISMVGSHDVEVSASTADTRKPPKVSRENKAAIIT